MDAAYRFRQLIRPTISFGPFRFLEAIPWLALAAAMRLIAYNNAAIALPALIIASVATLQAFILVTRRSIELTNGETGLGALEIPEQLSLSKAILWRVGALMIAVTALLGLTLSKPAIYFMLGIDGMAFDLSTTIGKAWSAIIATLVLLMVVNAETHAGKVLFFEAVAEFGRRWLWLGAAILVLFATYLLLGFVQGIVRNALVVFWQTSTSPQLLKKLTIFTFIFGFAMIRLWITVLILTYGLKQSYLRV